MWRHLWSYLTKKLSLCLHGSSALQTFKRYTFFIPWSLIYLKNVALSSPAGVLTIEILSGAQVTPMWPILPLVLSYDPAMSLSHLGSQGWRLWPLTLQLTKHWHLLVGREKERDRDRERPWPTLSLSNTPGTSVTLKTSSAFISKMYGVKWTYFAPLSLIFVFVHFRLVILSSVMFLYVMNATDTTALRGFVWRVQIIWLLCLISPHLTSSTFLLFLCLSLCTYQSVLHDSPKVIKAVDY